MAEQLINDTDTSLFEVVFYDCCDNETVVKQKFYTEADAETWADGCMFDYNDIIINDNGDDEWTTLVKYNNPEDNCSDYTGYIIQPFKS
ncbi:MAG: hypothetical protein WC979_02970 [Candidatus Pacearchaeota archaeon]|jgi:hypothetical protein|nr:hypothetical protein [Clostridia bacterium]